MTYGEVFKKVELLLMDRMDFYKRQPIDCLEDDELIAVMKMKLLRVQYGVDPDKRLDDLLDLIAYAVKLAKRWL